MGSLRICWIGWVSFPCSGEGWEDDMIKHTQLLMLRVEIHRVEITSFLPEQRCLRAEA